MANDPCDDNVLSWTADKLAEGKQGETEIRSVIEGERPSANPALTATAYKLGFFSKFRTQLGVWGDEFAVRVIQPVIRNNIEVENFTTNMYKEYKKALEPLGIDESFAHKLKTAVWGLPKETDEMLQKAIRLTDPEGKFLGREGTFPPEIVATARNVRKLYQKMADEHGLDPDTFFQYRDVYYKKPTGILRDQTDAPAEIGVRSRIKEGEASFFDELERKGIVGESDATATADYLAFLHALGAAKIRKPFLDKVEDELVSPWFNKKIYKDASGKTHVVTNDPAAHQAWEELKSHLYGSPTPMDRILTYQFKKLGAMFGKEDLDVRSTYRITQAITSLFYSGTLGVPLIGGRPGSVIRQLAQLVPTYAELGAKYTMTGMRDALDPAKIQALRDRNLLSSPVEAILESVSVARGVGRAISETTETSLKLFSLVDQYTRAATAYGKQAQFDDFLTRGAIAKLPMRKEMRDELLPLISRGQIEEARDKFIFDGVANLQYIYGKANRPEAFRGALGSMAGVFMSYPLNTAEMLRLFVKQGLTALPGQGGSLQDAVPLIRLMGLTGTLLWAGSEMLDVDMRSAFMVGALPSSMAFPKMGIDAFQMGKTNFEWLTGKTFLVGETDYHKKIRQEANKEFAKDFRAFVPGGTFFFEDIPKTIDEGTLTRLLGATPKAETLNEAARRRSREAREANQSDKGFAPIRGISRP